MTFPAALTYDISIYHLHCEIDCKLTSKFTLSTTSKNTSFFLYLIPSDRHETAFVTAIGGLACVSNLCDSCVMYLLRVSFSLRNRGLFSLLL